MALHVRVVERYCRAWLEQVVQAWRWGVWRELAAGNNAVTRRLEAYTLKSTLCSSFT